MHTVEYHRDATADGPALVCLHGFGFGAALYYASLPAISGSNKFGRFLLLTCSDAAFRVDRDGHFLAQLNAILISPKGGLSTRSRHGESALVSTPLSFLATALVAILRSLMLSGIRSGAFD